MRINTKLLFFVSILIGVCSSQDLQDSLIAHYSFDGNANDMSGNENHGIVDGAILTDDRDGIQNSAYIFDGMDDYISIQNYENFNNLSAFTITGWIYPMDFSSYGCIISKVLPNRDFDLKLYNGRLSLEFYNNFQYYVCRMDDQLPLDTWTFITGIWDGNNLKIYINSDHIKTSDFSGFSPAWTGTVLQIGRQSGIEAYNGKIDEVRIYKRVLSEEEIQLLYHGESKTSLSINTMNAFVGDTVQIPVNVQFPPDSFYSSAEINLSGYQGTLELIDIVTENSITGDANWTFQGNESDSLDIFWFAGAEDISGEGVLFWLKFAVPDTALGFIPITIESAIFNVGEQIETISGGLQIFPSMYGDVDLNNQIQAFDASLILKHLVNSIILDTFQVSNANVSLDSTISALDATLILQYGVGLLDSLPYDTSLGLPSASGNIMMEDVTIEAGSIVDIPLHLNNGNTILSFEGTILYNPEHLTYTGLEWSGMLEGFNIETSIIDGEIKFAGSGTIPSGESGVFTNLNLTVQENLTIDSTSVILEQLRWNEGEVQENIATSILTLVTGIDDVIDSPPHDYLLHQNYPNPFNPTTKIKFSLLKSDFVTIEIYNIIGESVKTLLNKDMPAGNHQVEFSAGDITSGVYFYRIEAGAFQDVKKMILIK
jgi:hypothetical protein